jgi:parallel beta-helix repeat protein
MSLALTTIRRVPVLEDTASPGVPYTTLDEDGGILLARLAAKVLENQDRILCVTDKGAAGTGLVDDTAAIQAAIDAVELAGGGTVLLPLGTFLVSSSLVMDSANVTLAGLGRGSIIKSVTNDEIVRGDNTSKLVIRDLQILGDADVLKTLQRGIQWVNVTDSLIQNVYVKNAGYDGILLLSGCVGNIVANNRVEGCQDDGINIGGDPTTASTGNIVIGNRVTGCVNTGIHISDGSSLTLATGNSISGCNVGIDTHQDAGNIGLGMNRIEANLIDSCTLYGIHIKDSDDNSVCGNTINGCQRSLRAENAERCQFLNNACISPSVGGFLDGSDCADLNLTNNHFVGATGTIRLNATRSRVCGNQIKGAGLAIQVASTGTGALIQGNTVTGGTGNNIEINGASRCVVSGNRLAAGDKGVYFVSGSVECVATGNVITEGAIGVHVAATDCVAHGNVLNGQTTYGIYAAASTRTKIISNQIKGAAIGINIFGATSTTLIGNTTTSSTTRGLAEDATSSGTFMFGNDLDGTLVLSGSSRTRVDKFTTSSAYTVTNPTTDRALNVTGDTLAQVAQVLGTLIADLQAIGLIG